MIIRWVCEKDSKKWMYPIQKCVYCKGPIKKQVSRKARVIGITKVNIPSPMHPIIPYNVILLEDDHGNRMPKKTMKDYKIGDDYRIEKAKQDSAVIATKIKYDLYEALKSSLELLNSFDMVEHDKVLIKPSIIEPAYSYTAVNTNPKILDALIAFLKEKNVNDIIVAEQAMSGNDTLDSAKKSGILEVCEKHNIGFVNLEKAEYVEKEADGIKLMIAKYFIERRVINLPVMKTNSQIGVSGAVENMMRCAHKDTQKIMFEQDIEKTLPKLLKALPPFLSIGDATIGMQGQGPTSLGEPAFLNMLFASKDPVALDAVFVEMGMLEMPQYLKECCTLGLGNYDSKTIEVVGDELEAIKFALKPAKKNESAHPKIKLIDGKADPCIFNSAIKATAKLLGLSGQEINLAIGSQLTKDMIADKNRLVAYGNDAIKKIKEIGINPLAEIPDGIDDVEKIVLLKSILENPEKGGITFADKIKSKIFKFGAKLKSSF